MKLLRILLVSSWFIFNSVSFHSADIVRAAAQRLLVENAHNHNEENGGLLQSAAIPPGLHSESYYHAFPLDNLEVMNQRKSLDEDLNPINVQGAKGDTGDDDHPRTRHRRIIVVYPDFDFPEDHHHDHYGPPKKGYGQYGGGGYGNDYGNHKKGYGSSTHYHPDTKYGYENHNHGCGYGGKGKKYYRRLRGPLSPILNWYYFGYL